MTSSKTHDLRTIKEKKRGINRNRTILATLLAVIFISGVAFGFVVINGSVESSAVPMSINQSAFPSNNNTNITTNNTLNTSQTSQLTTTNSNTGSTPTSTNTGTPTSTKTGSTPTSNSSSSNG